MCIDVFNIEKRSPPSKALHTQDFSYHSKCCWKMAAKKSSKRFSMYCMNGRDVCTEPLKAWAFSGERNHSHLTVCSTGKIKRNVLAIRNINNSTSSPDAYSWLCSILASKRTTTTTTTQRKSCSTVVFSSSVQFTNNTLNDIRVCWFVDFQFTFVACVRIAFFFLSVSFNSLFSIVCLCVFSAQAFTNQIFINDKTLTAATHYSCMVTTVTSNPNKFKKKNVIHKTQGNQPASAYKQHLTQFIFVQ